MSPFVTVNNFSFAADVHKITPVIYFVLLCFWGSVSGKKNRTLINAIVDGSSQPSEITHF